MKLNLITVQEILKQNKLTDYYITDKDDRLSNFQKSLNEYRSTILQKHQDSNSETNQIPVFNKLLSSVHNYHFEIDVNNIDISIWDNLKLKVIIEAKRESNKNEMINDNDLNKKALHEAILYYYEQRQKNVFSVNYVMITDYTVIYLFNAKEFETLINNKTIASLLSGYKNKELLLIRRTDELYKELSSILKNLDISLEACKIDLFDKNLDSENTYKILDRYNLLKTPIENKEHNILDPKFYNELLYIMGLQEIEEKVDGKKLPIIKQFLLSGTSNNSNLMTMVVKLIERARESKKIDNKLWNRLGETDHERYFNMSLELVLTWMNRILFLKLLEAQLISYHKNSQDIKLYQFLKFDKDNLSNWDDVDRLFFEVLAKPLNTREYKHIPYLNSALFEETEYENYISISSLSDRDKLEISKESILTDKTSKPVLEYLLEFLDSYHFGRGDDDISESKRLINASVLGLIFEQLNGYKDGAIYTPSFITMSMSRDSLTQTVIQKFNETYEWTCENLIEVSNSLIQHKISLLEANQVFNSIRIVDPAVGSGHFLVSVLNELLYIKHHGLGILCDKSGRLIRCDMEIISDELLISYDGTDFVYHVNGENKPLDSEMQRIQETLFHEKETLIENCLFGVDINPKSAYICQLRLWIELLKNTYYIQPTELDFKIENLQTLPNIDINIKTGNSLVSKFDLRQDFSMMMGSSAVKEYRKLVNEYKSTHDKVQKLEIKEKIVQIKTRFRKSFEVNDVDYQNLVAKHSKAKQHYESVELTIGVTQEQIDRAFDEMDKAEAILEKADSTYINSLEWWYEFPEVLDDEGKFIGFDLVIGNPPYGVKLSKDMQNLLTDRFPQIHQRNKDIFNYFIALGLQILKNKNTLTYIIPNTILTQVDFESMRNYLIKDNTLHTIINVGSHAFNQVVLCCVLHVSKMESDNYNINYTDYRELEKITIDDMYDLSDHQVRTTKQEVLGLPSAIIGMFGDNAKILTKLRANHKTLGEIAEEVASGISTGGDKIFRIHNDLVDQYNIESSVLKPVLKGSDIDSYYIPNDIDHSIIYTYKALNEKLIPNTIKYLGQFKEKLSQKRETVNGSLPYWCLHWHRHPKLFEDPKIVLRQTSDRIQAVYDDKGFYVLNSILVIKLIDTIVYPYMYTLGLLNSSVCQFLYKELTQESGRVFAEVKPNKLRELPIPQTTPEQQQPIIALVQQCMTAKASDKNADISHLQQQIDALVYQLYGLTDEEIKIVEGRE